MINNICLLSILLFILLIISNIFFKNKENFESHNLILKNEDYKKNLKIDKLDIIIKYLYAKYILLLEEENNIVDELYKKHIFHRTILNKKFSDKKRSIDEYKKTFKELFISMRNDGFSKSKIIFNNNLYHKNGSHRIALSLLLGFDIPYNKINTKFNYPSWGVKWFNDINYKNNKNIFSEEEIEYILYYYFKLKSEWNVLVLYSPTINYKPEINNFLSKNNINILHSKKINFNKSYQLKNFLREIYSFDKNDIYKSSNCVISKKLNKLNNYKNEIEILFIDKFDKNIKTKLRNMLGSKINVNDYITVHSADTIKERNYMLNILLNKNTMDVIMNVEKPYSNKLDIYLNEFSKTLKSLELDKEDVIIVGSSILDVYNLRATTDIDFAITKENRKIRGYSKKASKISNNVDIVAQNYSYHNFSRKGKFYPHKISDDNLIYDPIYFCLYRGFKFCSLKIIYDVKKSIGRPKDKKDVNLIDNYLLFN